MFEFMTAFFIYGIKSAFVFLTILIYLFWVEHFTYRCDVYFTKHSAYIDSNVLRTAVAIAMIPLIRDLSVGVVCVSILIGCIDHVFQNRLGSLRYQSSFHRLLIRLGKFTYETNHR
jgi:hypothetical protein